MPREHNIKLHSRPFCSAVFTIGNSEHIADIIFLWDCFQYISLENSPILLRLENFDLPIEWPDSHETPVYDTGKCIMHTTLADMLKTM